MATRAERIVNIKEEIEHLSNQRKLLIQKEKKQERTDRMRRLCQRMGLFESLLPVTITLTHDLFKIFLKKAELSDTSRKIPSGLITMSTTTAMPQASGSAARDVPAPASKTRNTAQENDEDADDDEMETP